MDKLMLAGIIEKYIADLGRNVNEESLSKARFRDFGLDDVDIQELAFVIEEEYLTFVDEYIEINFDDNSQAEKLTNCTIDELADFFFSKIQ